MSNPLKFKPEDLSALRDAIDEEIELTPDEKAEQRGEYWADSERDGD